MINSNHRLPQRTQLVAASGARRVCCVAVPVASGSSPKAVIFDLGKVLLDFDFTKSSSRLAAACTAAKPTRKEVLLELFGHAPAGQSSGLLDRWGGTSLVEQLERGQLSNRQFYELVVEGSGLQVDFPTFAALYADIFTEVPPMIEQQQRLVQRGVPTYLLSNCSGLHIDDVRQRNPFFHTFTGLILSYEVRSFKPDAEIYAAAEAVTGLSGSDLLFIDDRQENAVVAAQRGWLAIHHTSPHSTLQRLAELGLPVT